MSDATPDLIAEARELFRGREEITKRVVYRLADALEAAQQREQRIEQLLARWDATWFDGPVETHSEMMAQALANELRQALLEAPQ